MKYHISNFILYLLLTKKSFLGKSLTKKKNKKNKKIKKQKKKQKLIFFYNINLNQCFMRYLYIFTV
jgi:hypothetical protein